MNKNIFNELIILSISCFVCLFFFCLFFLTLQTYGQEGVPSWERLSQFIAASTFLSTKLPEISDMSKSVFHSFLVSQQKSPHVYLHVARFFLLGEKLAGDAKWGELAGYFSVFAEFLSELAAKEVWILRGELETQLLTCIQILRNMGILFLFIL
jgi:hypothetical protein